jgi:hypothetical protein
VVAPFSSTPVGDNQKLLPQHTVKQVLGPVKALHAPVEVLQPLRRIPAIRSEGPFLGVGKKIPRVFAWWSQPSEAVGQTEKETPQNRKKGVHPDSACFSAATAVPLPPFLFFPHLPLVDAASGLLQHCAEENPQAAA